jgi:hypothetical protein
LPAPRRRSGGGAQARWYLAFVRGRRVLQLVLAGACLLVGAGGCGSTRQDAGEQRATYALQVTAVRFPPLQVIARPTTLALRVRNAGAQTAPNVAVSVDSFYYRSEYPNLSSPQRPVWVVEQGPGPPVHILVQTQAINPPGGAETAYVNTWTLGPLAPGATQTYLWHVVPVKPGAHAIHFIVSPGLAGKAQARLPSGGPVVGHLTALISSSPPRRHVDPRTGLVVPGRAPLVP